MNEQTAPQGPDLRAGVKLTELTDGKLLGRIGEEQVLLVRGESGIFAVGAYCTHYHGLLADGLVVGNSIRCPGTMPASTCVAAKRCVHRHSIPSTAGRSRCAEHGLRARQSWCEQRYCA